MLKGVTKTIKSETKEQKGRLLSMLLGTLGAGLLGNILPGKGIVKAGSGNKKTKRNCKSWSWKRMGFLIPSHPLTNFEILNIIIMNHDLMAFSLETICLKK